MRRFRTGIALILLASTGAARATCLQAAAPVAAGPIGDHFALLLAADKYRDVPAMITAWRTLIADAKAVPGVPAEIVARSYGWLAWSLDYVDKTDEALAAATAAERLVTQAGLGRERFHADVLSTLAMVRIDLGKVDDGARDAAAALALATRDGPASSEASFAHNAMGGVAYARGDYAGAVAEYGAATRIAVACLAPTDALIVNQMASYAGTLYMVGRVEDALAENERAANWALANLTSDNPVITLALGNLGVMLRSAGRYAEAEAALRRVVDLEGRYQKDRWYYRAISLSNFASVIEAQGRHEEAEALWLTASEFHGRATIKRDPVTPAYPLRFAADAAQARGDLALALARRDAGLKLVEHDVPADHPELARARIEYAQTLTLLHRPAEALALAEPAIAVVRAKLVATDPKRLTAEIAFARIVGAVRGAEAGYALAAPVAAQLETRLLNAATSRGELLRYGPVFSASFATVVDLALAAHHDAAAFRALQLANLSDVVIVSNDVATRAATDSPVAGELIRDLQDRVRARQLLDRGRSFAASANDAAELKRLDLAIHASDVAIAAATGRLDADYPAFRALARPTPIDLAGAAAQLAPDQIILAPLLVDDGTLAIGITRSGLVWRKTPVTRPAAERLVGRISASIAEALHQRSTAAPFDSAAAAELYAAIAPADLAGFRHVIYFASGRLAAISPALLLTRPLPAGRPLAVADWLIRDHSISVAVSLATRPVTSSLASGFLGVGAPMLASPAKSTLSPFRGNEVDRAALGSLPPLPAAARELRRLAAAAGDPSPTMLLGRAATTANVVAALGRPYRTIAFATHALTAGSVGGMSEPALVLTPTAGNDGLLSASLIAGLRLRADWAVLSACDSGGAGEAGGAAFSGLATAFLHAGARALLVSQWAVRDDAAERITVATMRGASEGMARPVALQHAVLALMGDRHFAQAAHPAVWAPFVLIDR